MKQKLLLSLFALLAAMTARADVEINETTFPDANFRAWVLSQDFGADGVLTANEIAGVKSIGVSDKGIGSLQGIEYFTALFALSCPGNLLTALDVSKNTELKYLECYDNQLTTLDVSKNTALTKLYCNSNQLTALDVSKNTELGYLKCYNNQLTALDVSKNTKLTGLDCHNNQLTALDVSKNTALVWLYCYQNQIKDEAMDALVVSLPTVSLSFGGYMYVIYNENEGNVMTTEQAAAAKAKRWIPQYYDGNTWQEFAGSEPDGINSLTPALSKGEEELYDLSGRRLSKMQRGVNIVNGRKVLK